MKPCLRHPQAPPSRAAKRELQGTVSNSPARSSRQGEYPMSTNAATMETERAVKVAAERAKIEAADKVEDREGGNGSQGGA